MGTIWRAKTLAWISSGNGRFLERFARMPLFFEAAEREWTPSANITETDRQFSVTA
jgi:hypothetical protein